MKASKSPFHTLAVLVAILCSTLNSPAPWYAKFDGVDGSSTDAGHEGDSDILSFTQSHSRTNSQPSPTLNEATVSKSIDKASPILAEACANGTHIPEVVLSCRKAGGTTNDFYKVTLQNVYITSYQVGGDSSTGDSVPTEQLALNYTEIEWSYVPQDAVGNPLGPPIVAQWPPGGPQ